MRMHTSLLALSVIFLTSDVYAGIQTFKHTALKPDPGYYFYKQGMFSADHAPSKSAPGNGKSFISVNVNVSSVEKGYAGITTIFVFNSDRKDDIGAYQDNKHYVCCTEELLQKYYCTTVGEAIYNNNSDEDGLWTLSAKVDDTATTVTTEGYFNITRSGMYWIYIVNCHTSDESSGVVQLDGRIVFMNPYGYLNGEYFYLLPFYGTLALMYIILGIFWCVVSLKHRKKLLRLQNAITGVIILGIFETAILFFDNIGFNNIGLNYVGAMIVGVLVSTVKKTISRVLVLVVSMGYGVTHSRRC